MRFAFAEIIWGMMISIGISIPELIERRIGSSGGGGPPAPDDTTSANEYLIFFI